MARIDDLVAQIPDATLRQRVATALADMKRRQRFGLVYEDHVPETTALLHFPVQRGATVQRRSDALGKLYQVASVTKGIAQLEPEGGGTEEKAKIDDLLVVKRFGDPIFPALASLGVTQNALPDRPYHAVINGENFHTLQLLVYLYEGQLDCIYIDPPYNTGSRDWKYNNRYVDGKDSWRHSKWLSFMEKRLRLAKALLKSTGVLIVTIDEHEVHHLGMLLEKLFPEAYRQMVTIVINPKGVTQTRFSRVDEYAFFVFMGDAGTTGRADDLLTPGVDDDHANEANQDEAARPRWKGLLRSGDQARRQDRKNMFYPVLIDPKRMAVVDVGQVLPFEEEPNFSKKIRGLVPVWPVRRDGSLGRWGVGPLTLKQLVDKGYVSLGERDSKRNTWAISYLSQELQEQVLSGALDVAEYDQNKNVVDVRYSGAASRRMKTVWHRSRHDAGVGGTDVLRDLLGGRPFSFPKSVYAVHDCLAAVLRDKPNALVLDFFAGSGTTFHATAMLNASDGGSRRCILVTNNEVEVENASKLKKQGLIRGEPEFERHGIFEMVTRPRCEAVVTGKRTDGSSIPGTHINGRPYALGFQENVEFFRVEYLDADDVDLGNQFQAIYPSLWLAAGGFGERISPSSITDMLLPASGRFGVLLQEQKFKKFLEQVIGRPDLTHVWIVTDSEDAFSEMRAMLPARLITSMLYRDYLRNFRINTRRNV